MLTVSKKTRWEPRLGAFVDLVELDDVANGGVALFKTVKALRGTVFFSTIVSQPSKCLKF